MCSVECRRLICKGVEKATVKWRELVTGTSDNSHLWKLRQLALPPFPLCQDSLTCRSRRWGVAICRHLSSWSPGAAGAKVAAAVLEQCVSQVSGIGCHRNSQIFFRFEPKQTETQSVPVVFRFVSRNQQKQISGLFQFVLVFRTGIETTETNRTLSKQTETNRKKLQKTFSSRGSSKKLIFFSVRTEKNRNSICFGCFSVCFSRNPKKFFGLFRCSGPVRNNRNKQNLWYGEFKTVDILTNLLLFRLVFFCFGCFKTPKLPVSILKRNNWNNRLVSDSAETTVVSVPVSVVSIRN
jgi:hypothetical protein